MISVLVIKPMTDVSRVIMEPEPRKCKCGCGVSFRVAVGSNQKYRSEDCVRLNSNRKLDQNAIWRRQMNFMVKW